MGEHRWSEHPSAAVQLLPPNTQADVEVDFAIYSSDPNLSGVVSDLTCYREQVGAWACLMVSTGGCCVVCTNTGGRYASAEVWVG